MSIDVSDIVNDSDLGSEFIIERSFGKYGAGGWTVTNVTNLLAFGPVRNASGKELQQLPEADRIAQGVTFRSVTEMHVTTAKGKQTSDILIWHGEKYRVVNTKDYREQGYFYAMAERISGK